MGSQILGDAIEVDELLLPNTLLPSAAFLPINITHNNSHRHYGTRVCFGGPALTLRMWDHNGSLIDDITLRLLLSQEGGGQGRVLVIDNGGSAANACMGANLAGLASEHGA